MTAIKVCGITRPRDAAACAGEGIRYLGLNFAAASPRRVDLEAARQIVAAAGAEVVWVGVFADERPERIAELVARVPLSLVQLHGDETPAQAAAWGERAWKVVHVGDENLAESIERYPSVSALLLDQGGRRLDLERGGARGGARGGTGRAWDFALARPFAARRPVWIAGGLGPENVAAAILAARPFGVDVNSRVEVSPGVKDIGRIREVVKEVERADRQIARSGEVERA
jgi:phosphoribosylanthranilate isomerase